MSSHVARSEEGGRGERAEEGAAVDKPRGVRSHLSVEAGGQLLSDVSCFCFFITLSSLVVLPSMQSG